MATALTEVRVYICYEALGWTFTPVLEKSLPLTSPVRYVPLAANLSLSPISERMVLWGLLSFSFCSPGFPCSQPSGVLARACPQYNLRAISASSFLIKALHISNLRARTVGIGQGMYWLGWVGGESLSKSHREGITEPGNAEPSSPLKFSALRLSDSCFP